MFNDWAAASREQQINFSAGIAWFGDILKIEAPFVEIGPRSVFAKSAVGVRQRQWGRVCAGPDPAGPGVVGREAWGESIEASESEGREPAVREKRQNEAKLLER